MSVKAERLTGDGAGAPAATALVTEHLARRAVTQGGRVALTFVDYSVDRAGRSTSLTYAELARQVAVLAGRIARRVEPGERLAILAPQGIDYVLAFLAALRAGVVAVPLFPPDLPGHADRLAAVFADCQPACVATTTAALPGVRAFLDGGGHPAAILVVDEPEPDPSGTGSAGASADAAFPGAAVADAPPAPAEVAADDLAYLQYTSGSTRDPAGVLITHGNLAANAAQAVAAYASDPAGHTLVSWLPLFHDMGLVFVIGGGLAGGYPVVFMDPIAFLRRPVRWLRHLSDHPGTITFAPNFAFDFCVSRIREPERADLRLDRVATMVNGAEPVRAATLARFTRTFGPYGLRPHVIRPSYGLAEATVYVSGSAGSTPPRLLAVDPDRLAAGWATPAAESDRWDAAAEPEPADGSDPAQGSDPAEPLDPTTVLVSCGSSTGQRVAVVDPETGRVQPDGAVGEIWVHGPNVAAGYWGNAPLTAATFGQTLPADADADADAGNGNGNEVDAGPAGGPRSDDWPARPWLRTGDLGVRWDGELFVTGRMKDLIVVDGRNHYPQDVEATAEAAHVAVGHHRSAAFSVPEADGGERVVVVAELSRHALDGGWEAGAVEQAVRQAVSARHGIALADVVLTPPAAVPRTTSGKIARQATRRHYLAGGFQPVGGRR